MKKLEVSMNKLYEVYERKDYPQDLKSNPDFPLKEKEFMGRRYKVQKVPQQDFSTATAEKCQRLATTFISVPSSTGRALQKIDEKGFDHVISATSVKRMMFPSKVFKIHTCAMTDPKPTFPSSPQLEILQEKLNSSQIALNCLSPPPLINKCKIDHAEIKDYLDLLKEYFPKNPEFYEIKKKLFDNIDMLSYQELLDGIAVCCNQLNQLLGDQDYSIGFVPQKSQQWIAEQALPYLRNFPNKSFKHFTDAGMTAGGIRGQQEKINQTEKVFVVFDDCSYSGNQLHKLIGNLKKAVGDAHQDEKCHLYLVVPFISPSSRNYMESYNQLAMIQGQGNLQIDFITTDREVVAMKDRFTLEEIEKLAELDAAEVDRKKEHLMLNYIDDYDEGVRETKRCLTVPEWKLPDDVSIPHAMTYNVALRKNFIIPSTLPYKIPKPTATRKRFF